MASHGSQDKSRLLNQVDMPRGPSSHISFPALSLTTIPWFLLSSSHPGLPVPLRCPTPTHHRPVYVSSLCLPGQAPAHWSAHSAQSSFSGKPFLGWLWNLSPKPGYFSELECCQRLTWDPPILCTGSSAHTRIALYPEGWESRGGDEG